MIRTRNMFYRESIASEELRCYAINHSVLYQNSMVYIIANLTKKVEKGIYDRNKAIDLFYSYATNASNFYKKEFGHAFSVQERFTVAVDLEIEFQEGYIID